VCNSVEGIQCRIKSLGLFKGTVPLLRHTLSRISSLGLFKGTVPLLRLYCWIPSFCDSTVPNPWCLFLLTAASCTPYVQGRLFLVVTVICRVVLIVCSSYLRLVGSSGDVESRGLFLLHARTHFKQKKKKKLHLGLLHAIRKMHLWIHI
jgi:hypothetical protein